MHLRKIDKKKCRFAVALYASTFALASYAKLKTSWDVGDYVQDGLIAHYDGIRNAGAALPHDSTATTWVDIAPNQTSGGATVSLAKSGKDKGSWTSKGYAVSGWSYLKMANAITLGMEYTIQIACDVDLPYYKPELTDNYPCPFGSGEFGFYLARYASSPQNNTLTWKTDAYSNSGSSGNRPSFNWSGGRYINAAMTAERMYMTQDASWSYYRDRNVDNVAVPALTYTFGGRSGRNGGNCTTGEYYSVRIYSRKLTDTELAWNRAIDERRFHEKNVMPYTNVVVKASLTDGLCGTEPPGVYAVDGEHTFTAPDTKTVSLYGNDCVYSLEGYRIQEWDSVNRAWTEGETFAGNSYTYSDASPQSTMVRLTWLWRLESGIRRLDVCDYIKDGLISQFDGIRNVAEDEPHDSSSAVWKDLAYYGNHATNRPCVYMQEGYWVSNAYHFAGKSCMETVLPITLGSEFTIQVACDVDIIDDGRTYPSLWAAKTDTLSDQFAVFIERTDGFIGTTTLVWKVDKYSNAGSSSNRPQLRWAEGKFLNAAFDTDRMYLTDTVKWPAGVVRGTPGVEIPSLLYSMGGRFQGGDAGGTNMCHRGDFYQVRYYTRKLTDFELAWNRDVDEVRYYGGLPTTISNAVVVARAQEGFSSAEDGVYLLTDTYEFTAEKRKIDGVSFAPAYTIETWDSTADAWVKSSRESGESCVLKQSESTAPRRIVWSWHKEGFSVTVR